MPHIPFSSPVASDEDIHEGNVPSDDSEYNESMDEIMQDQQEYYPEPATPQAADYFPMMLPEGFNQGDHEFQDRPEDDNAAVNAEFPWHHLTYTCYPMRAPDTLRRNGLNPISNAFLRPGSSQDFPDGLRLVFVNWLKKYDLNATTGVSVGLWRTVGPDPMLVVVKRIKGWKGRWLPNGYQQRTPLAGEVPGEVAYNNLPDPMGRTLKFSFLYHPHLTCLPQTHAFQLNNWPEENVTHFGKFYNGGQVEYLIDRYKDQAKPIPEAMIWHVIAQVGRAYKFVHTGRTMPEKTQERGSVRGPPRRGREEREWMAREEARAKDWVPTAHCDGHSANIWLHFATQYERENDRENCLEQFDDCFPQVTLGDFGLAVNRESNNSFCLMAEECPDLPDRESWKDKAEFGLTLHHMLLAGRRELPKFTMQAIPEDWAEIWAEYLDANYSKTLIDVVKRFSHVAHLCDKNRHGVIPFARLMEMDYNRWKDGFRLLLAPSNEWFHHAMIDLADKEVDERRRSRDGVDSVRWATGQRMSTMPYQVPNRTKYSRKIKCPGAQRPEDYQIAIPLDGKETLRSKARIIYTRKLRRPVTGAFLRHPPAPVHSVDKDKLWVSKTYRFERIRYRKPRDIKIEYDLKGDLKRKQTPFTPPPSPGEVEAIETIMFGPPGPWNSWVLQWDREGRGDGDESPGMKDWSRFGANQNGGSPVSEEGFA
ncbi:hypothetical protein N0V85_008763 [Neurospora sp. IMI 360204]|nr:hypothetical protein N0V85_008763 [Neurospora sp. IMI 360204]